MMEIALQEAQNEHYFRLKRNLTIVLEFVERWNKQDAEIEVAQAAQFLKRFIN
jgi:hypothetical protein